MEVVLANVIKILEQQLIHRAITERELTEIGSDNLDEYKKDTDKLIKVYKDELINQTAKNILCKLPVMDKGTVSDYKQILN